MYLNSLQRLVRTSYREVPLSKDSPWLLVSTRSNPHGSRSLEPDIDSSLECARTLQTRMQVVGKTNGRGPLLWRFRILNLNTLVRDRRYVTASGLDRDALVLELRQYGRECSTVGWNACERDKPLSFNSAGYLDNHRQRVPMLNRATGLTSHFSRFL